MKKRISQAVRLQLIGLLSLAKHHNGLVARIHDAAAATLGIARNEPGPDDYLCDAIYTDHDADALLKKLDIQVTA